MKWGSLTALILDLACNHRDIRFTRIGYRGLPASQGSYSAPVALDELCQGDRSGEPEGGVYCVASGLVAAMQGQHVELSEVDSLELADAISVDKRIPL
ncbi:hypothetical protein C6W88_19275 [Halomonas litopenaei]|uniref:RES domain-containing protein n=1 Tax=Halomonas litopenaei TaxID=2109328 RepID=A0ABX5IWK0_9GAMM|nr:hypothetical protein C6W88_19275 [Halomonas litopenaei]PTL89428.1 hypothetical protein C6W89_17985 [Halomonas sp. SYSU XM8]